MPDAEIAEARDSGQTAPPAASRDHHFEERPEQNAHKCSVWWRAILLAAVVLGAKWTLVTRFGGETPFGDEWMAEIATICLPAWKGELSWRDLFKSHNEHRIMPTNLLNLAMFRACGDQVDPRVQVAVSSVLHAFWFALVGAWLARLLRPSFHPVLFALLLLLGVAPFAYENTLWAFQSQFYFVLIFWSAAAWGLCFNRLFSFRWWLGLVAGVLAVLSFGPGGLIGVGILAVLALRSWVQCRVTASEIASAVAAVLLVAASFVLRPEVQHHASLRSDSWATYSLAVWRLLGWPANIGWPMGILLWLPGFWLLKELSGRRMPMSRLGEIGVLLIALAAAIIAATAFFRGQVVSTEGIAPRYLDLFSLGIIGNFIALLNLVACPGPRLSLRYGLLISWMVVVRLGIGAISVHLSSTALPFWRQSAGRQVALLRTYLHRHDMSVLAGRTQWEIGHPDPEKLAMILGDVDVPALLPPALHVGMTSSFRFPEGGRYQRGGVDPAIPAPPGLPTWGDWRETRAPGSLDHAESLPFSSSGGHALFSHAVSGAPGTVSFRFIPVEGGELVEILALGDPAAEVWRESTIWLPSGRYWLEVVDSRNTGWSAITQPRRISPLGLYVRWLLPLGPVILAASFLGLTLSVWWPLRVKP